MERDDDHWFDDDRQYTSESQSDDSPVLLRRYEKYRHYTKEGKYEEKERRSTITVLAKFFLFCAAMIMFCVLMYIPVYNKANDQVTTKGAVAGWSMHANRDTKIYVQPNNVTTIHEPTNVCPKDRQTKNKLFLLIVVCSSTLNFDSRLAIRETWGDYKRYLELSAVFKSVTEKYKNYNYSYDLYSETDGFNTRNVTHTRHRRDMALSKLLPELAKALVENLKEKNDIDKTDEVEEERFADDVMLPEFDMNKELNDQQETVNYDFDYDTNVMKIPPRGYEDTPNLDKVLEILKKTNILKQNGDSVSSSGNAPDFKLVFLLGLPGDNNSAVQAKIDEEVAKYGDVIQERFVDSYNNLTLKSIMMLKWITNNCNESVRYVLKTDDDMYINVPNLVANLRNRSAVFDKSLTIGERQKEYLLIGDLICGARPVLDATNKWYSPRYMYPGRMYPRYLSGTGYLLSAAAAAALYAAAGLTDYFHLEDIYITGMCSRRATPRLTPRDDPTFTYAVAASRDAACSAHARVTTHHMRVTDMTRVAAALTDPRVVDRCERRRLTQVRRDRLKPKTKPKTKPKRRRLPFLVY